MTIIMLLALSAFNYQLHVGAYNKMSRWIPAIGLEVHAPIRAAVKIFSGGLSQTSYEAVNESIAFFDLALPGSLPVRKIHVTVLLLVYKSSCFFLRKHSVLFGNSLVGS